jgi:glycosyltransferase involved in cell wall biosynthesis
MDTYYRPAWLKLAVEALFRQTYENLEIILVNNGATEETIEYLYQVENQDKRVKLIHFSENQFSMEDPCMMVNCWNAGLEKSTGDYIWYQADDDLLADDYAEKMVALFQGNSECTTAAGRTVTIDPEGNAIRTVRRSSNYRPRYMPGHLLSLDKSRGGTVLVGAPSCIFTMKRDELVKAGGFHRAMPRNELFGVVPFGVTGYDDEAIFYNRRHEGQLHKLTNEMGWTGSPEIIGMLEEWDIEGRWQIFGAGMAREVVKNVKQEACEAAALRLVRQVYSRRIRSGLYIMRKMGRHRGFWISIPKHAKNQFFLRPLLSRLLRKFSRLLVRPNQSGGTTENR